MAIQPKSAITQPYLLELPPAPDLRPYVRRYLAINAANLGGEMSIPAWTQHVLTIHYGEGVFSSVWGDKQRHPMRFLIAGAANAPYRLRAAGATLSMFCVSFTHTGLSRLLRAPAHEFTGTAYNPLECLTAEAQRAFRHCASEPFAPHLQKRLMDTFLRGLLRTRMSDAAARVTQQALGFIEQGPMLSPTVADVAKELMVSDTLLRRYFRETVGVSTKRFLQARRSGLAFNALVGQRALSHAQLSARLGYADQAHFIRDFRAFAGVSPTRLKSTDFPAVQNVLAQH